MNLTALVVRRSVIAMAMSALTSCLWMSTGMAWAQGTASFQGLGDLPGGGVLTEAHGVSADGSVVVGRGWGANGTQAFQWTQSQGMVGLASPTGPAGCGGTSQAYATSADGAVIVGFSYNATCHNEATKWTPALSLLGTLANADWAKSTAYGISADGTVIVGQSDSVPFTQAARWQGGSIQALGFLSGHSLSEARAVSADGTVAVGTSSFSNQQSTWRAVRWTGTAIAPLGDLPGGAVQSQAFAVSADGSVIVGASASANGTFEAFRWENNVMTPLGDLPGGVFMSEAFGVSADGSVVVGRGHGNAGQEAFIWRQATGMRSLREVLVELGLGAAVSGWALWRGTAISADGLTIVGNGGTSAGLDGWIARLSSPDTDGDGLLDAWETQGHGIDINSDGVIDLDLFALGARPNHKDLFVEIDCMSGLVPTSLTPVVTAFANAPVSNPDNVTGINLHLQIDDLTLPVSGGWTETNTFPQVDNLKSIFFGTAAQRGSPNSVNILAAKRKAYRYCVYASSSDGYAAGVAAGIPADDIVVFQLTIANAATTNMDDWERGVFMHELGHALGLQHGGGDGIYNKPNYISVMNYLVNHPFDTQGWVLDFSHGTMLPIIENNIDESVFLVDPTGHNNGRLTFRPNVAALCPSVPCDPVPTTTVFVLGYTIGTQPRDINGDLQITSGICMDVNYHGSGAPIQFHGATPTPCDIMNDHNDWAALQYALVDEGSALAGTPISNPPVELTVAEIQALAAFLPGPPCLADIDESGAVDVDDLIAVILNWGPCAAPPSLCSADIAPLPVNNAVDVDDLIAVILAWGDCP